MSLTEGARQRLAMRLLPNVRPFILLIIGAAVDSTITMGYKARLIAKPFCLEASWSLRPLQACECGGIGIHSRLKIC